MGIRETIARARQAQQDHPQKHSVQLEITLDEIEEEEAYEEHKRERIAQMVADGEQAARELGAILPATYDEYMTEFRRVTLPFTEWGATC